MAKIPGSRSKIYYIIPIILVIVLFYVFFRRLRGKRGTSAVYNHSYLDWKRTFPHAFTLVDAQTSVQRTSQGEQRCRNYLESKFKASFDKHRPSFLKNPITHQELELDCYNAQLNLAVEYNGEQHYKFIPYFHKTRDAFYNQQYRDRIKRDICKEKGIVLIEVPYTVTNIEQFLENELQRLGFINSAQSNSAQSAHSAKGRTTKNRVRFKNEDQTFT